jgi:ABC-2 type transport system ATP-binding protein
MENVIECRGLTHRYGKRVIYENINFDVPRGRILGLLGKNGTGKTTTINILSGYLKPTAGECRIFGENVPDMRPETRANIGLLIEGHVQYRFMNIDQIEKFYRGFYGDRWQGDAYRELMAKLKVSPKQPISRMSCGQRSQVALGLLLAQNSDLLVLDDFSLGLDPGYRRLFVEYLREYAANGNKTVFLTSHIIQDMEKLIDDCIIMDYGKILTQCPVNELTEKFRRYTMTVPDSYNPEFNDADLYHPMRLGKTLEVYSFLPQVEVEQRLRANGVPFEGICSESLNLEDAFIGLTGKY